MLDYSRGLGTPMDPILLVVAVDGGGHVAGETLVCL